MMILVCLYAVETQKFIQIKVKSYHPNFFKNDYGNALWKILYFKRYIIIVHWAIQCRIHLNAPSFLFTNHNFSQLIMLQLARTESTNLYVPIIPNQKCIPNQICIYHLSKHITMIFDLGSDGTNPGHSTQVLLRDANKILFYFPKFLHLHKSFFAVLPSHLYQNFLKNAPFWRPECQVSDTID